MANQDCITRTKVCTRCKRELPASTEHFSPSKLGKYGLNSRCKPCLAEIGKQKRAECGAKSRPNRHKDGKRQCSKCEKWYPETDEYFGVRSDNGLLCSWCKNCRRETFRERMRNKRQDPEYVASELAKGQEYYRIPEIRKRNIEYSRKWREDNIEHRRSYEYVYERTEKRRQDRRARNHTMRAMRNSAEGTHTREDIEQLYASQKGKCWWCGKKLKGKYEVDHRIPLSRGGTNRANNLCLTCQPCNRSKNSKLPHEWIGRLL